jgi:hypothetical protein
MKDRRVEKLVDELKFTVDRLNRLNAILARTGTTFYLNRSTRDGDFMLSDVEQRIEYK